MMRLVLLAVMTTVWLAVFGAPTAAAPSFPTVYRPTSSEALAHFMRGNDDYERGTDTRRALVDREHALRMAIEEYAEGEKLEPAALAFAFNTAMAYRALGQNADAVDYFERFLARMRPEDGWLRESVEKKIEALDPSGALRAKRIEREKQRAPATEVPPPAPVTVPPEWANSPHGTTAAAAPTTGAPPSGQSPPLSVAAPGLTSTTTPQPVAQPPHWRARAGWLVTTVGLVGGGVTTYELFQRAQSLDSQSQDELRNPGDATRQELAARASQERRTALVVGLASAGVVATGLTLALWPYEDHPRTAWRFGITSHGFAVLGSF